MSGMNMKGALAAVVIFAVVLINQCSSQATNQRATLYSGKDGQGNWKTLTETYSDDLSKLQFDNKAYSVCVTGVWLFYDNINYNKNIGTMEYVYGPDNYCINFKNLGGRLSSLRFSGYPKNYQANTLTLYQGDYFQGAEEYTFVDLKNLALDRNASSLIVTGLSAWTLYAKPNHEGDSVCVYPPEASQNKYTPAFIYDTTTISIPQKSIRSVKLGCHSKRKHVATAFEPNVLKSFSTSPNVDAIHESNDA